MVKYQPYEPQKYITHRYHKLRLVSSCRQGTWACPEPTSPPSRIRASSASFTDGICSGRSRNHHQNATHHTAPITPNIQKRCLQWTTSPDSEAWLRRSSETTSGV